MNTIYRSTRIILNDNNHNFVVEGYGAMRGTWEKEPTETKDWLLCSNEVGVGVSGYIRLSTGNGYISIMFNMGWSSPPFVFEIINNNKDIDIYYDINDSSPDNIVVNVTIK